MDKLERLKLINQYLILEALYPDEAEYYSRHREALEKGFTLHYDWMTENLYDELSEEECRFVLDVLNMYRAITFSNNDLPEDEKLDDTEIRFPGFDGNNEGLQLSYTVYFIVRLGRYDELRREGEYTDFNSHAPMMDLYQRMLATWSEMGKPHRLDREKIEAILKV